MVHKIDVHGLSHNQAIVKVENELISLSISKNWIAEVVTGKSSAMQDKIIKEVLDLHNFSYYIPGNNHGVIIVEEDVKL